jgi:hypothetical protein
MICLYSRFNVGPYSSMSVFTNRNEVREPRRDFEDRFFTIHSATLFHVIRSGLMLADMRPSFVFLCIYHVDNGVNRTLVSSLKFLSRKKLIVAIYYSIFFITL